MRRSNSGCCCLFSSAALVFLLLSVFSVYLFIPLRTNILLIGMDYADPWNDIARSDTLILSTFVPVESYIGMLSIPRDLWVTIPGVGENRINTAHFYAEARQTGTGPSAVIETVELNFGVDVDNFMRIRFEGFREVVSALGGVTIELTEPMGGYPAGVHHLTGRKALAFVRHRAGSDDFNRMQQAQFMIKVIIKNILQPENWSKIPAVATAFLTSVDTNISAWQMPRYIISLLWVGPDGIDSRIISRALVIPFTSGGGASVLAPNWVMINPILEELFGQ